MVGSEETGKFLASFGGDQLTMPPDKAQELFLKEINNWAEYVRIARDRACRVKQADAGGPVAMVPRVATSTERKSR